MIKNVRWANERDAADLVRLNEEFNTTEMTISEVQESLANSKELVALAMIDDHPVGFGCAQYFKSFCYDNLQGEITEMYITEVARGKGLATMLISFIEEELQIRGVKCVKVITNKKNEKAINTYQRSQYVKTDHLILRKTLSER